ncbi:MAG: RNA polymerase sigma factor [Cyclonatronaceae bacterium]
MNYTQLIEAINENDSRTVDNLLSSLYPVLVNYLCITMNAGLKDAEDCAQEALITVVENIRNNGIRNPGSIFSYVITVSRHAYLRLRRNDMPGNYVDFEEAYHVAEPADQLENLLDEERARVLEECIEAMNKENREMIELWFENPDRPTDEIAAHFNISINNAWIRKHRIMKFLIQCVEKKLS